MRPRFALAASVAAGATATIAISVLPIVHFAYRSPRLHLAVELAAAFVALLAAYLLYGRYRSSRSLPDLALLCSLALFGVTNLCFAALPAVVGVRQHEFDTWAPLAGRVMATAVLAASPFLPERTVPRPGRAAAGALAAAVLLLSVLALTILVAQDHLPRGIDPGLSPESSDRPRIVGNGGVLALQLLAMTLFFTAAVGFARRAERSADELMTWFAVGAGFAAFARLNYFLFPSIYSEWVYTGDILRLAFWLVVLIGLVREIGSYWRRLAEAAVLEERRRLARDLHDGLAHELAFIATQARRVSSESEQETALRHVANAAERALDESRSAIAALTLPLDEPVDVAVARAAEDVAGRVGVRLRFDLEEHLEAPPEIRDALVRIVREAVTNAARHGGADVVRVTLERKDNALFLSIADDGSGFEPDRVGSGFGLRSIKERAQAAGGVARISSAPSHGTVVNVEVRR